MLGGNNMDPLSAPVRGVNTEIQLEEKLRRSTMQIKWTNRPMPHESARRA